MARSVPTPTGFSAILLSMGRALAAPFVALADAQSRFSAYQRLADMSDAQLASRGLAREDIPRHVFADLLDEPAAKA